MFARLADRFVLCPTRHGIPAAHKARRTVRVGSHQVEVWIERTDGRSPPTIMPAVNGRLLRANGSLHPIASNGHNGHAHEPLPEPEIFVLKFNGSGGRAEQASIHPLDFWSDLPGEIWSPNPPGFGASEGSASLRWFAPMSRAVLTELLAVAGSRPIIIIGNSLGTTVALHVAAHFSDVPNLVGLISRNPPPLRELIAGKFGWRTLGISHLVARKVPRDLDSLVNAARVRLPCVFLCSGRDRIVPPRFQQMIHDAYAGEKRVLPIPAVDHVFEFAEPEIGHYAQALTWLREAAGLKLNGASVASADCNLQESGARAE